MAQPFTLRDTGDEWLLESCFVFCLQKYHTGPSNTTTTEGHGQGPGTES